MYIYVLNATTNALLVSQSFRAMLRVRPSVMTMPVHLYFLSFAS